MAMMVDRTAARTTALPVLHLPNLLSSWANRMGEIRGLEDRIDPLLAMKRRIARIYTIRMVIQSQWRVRDSPELLRSLSRILSHPARRLGHIVALADETAARMVELGDHDDTGDTRGRVGAGDVLCVSTT